MKALFLVNARSGRRRKFDVVEVIRRGSTCPYEIVDCGRKEDLPSIVDYAEREGFDVVYAVGGDGTVHETAKRLIGRGPALGVLPIGSGNGFARHIGLPLDLETSLRACAGARIVPIDTAEVNGEPIIGVMGIGFDALVAERFASSSVRGLRTYVQEGVLAFTRFRADDYEITTNGRTIRQRAFVVAVANSGQYGNNARIAPLASVRDGMLDVVIVDEASLLRALLLLPHLFRGTINRAAEVHTMQTTEVTIRRPHGGAAHLDGEPYQLPAELHVRIRPLSLKVLVPDATRRL
ncbi:MAG TPA: YegS/Rv2252/BmrU family lipid kinase [Thermoanaerobaculia bacterium]|nr:YegS/Rv2252/BmrU family lipid kinase [Thermoanaerobaculia bacterium]